MAQASVLPHLAGEALDLEGRRLGVGEQPGGAHLQLHLASRQVRIDRLARALHDRAAHPQHVLGAQFVGQLERLTGLLGMEDELHDAGAVAQVDEDQTAVITTTVHPAGHGRLAADAVAEHLAAPGVAVGVGTQRRELAHAALPVIVPTRSPVATARCSPLDMSRSCAPSSSRMTTRRAPSRSACLSWPLRPRPPRSISAERPALRSSPASTKARTRCSRPSPATATKTSRPGAATSSSRANTMRSIPAAQPTAGVGAPPSCSIRLS